ncbi:MAG: helix-turn-helix transcriptional regulator [bacterium]|nr:helix-turn-helix transcriptional regulator [bacterium]
MLQLKKSQNETKIEIGKRFRLFRNSVGKAQHELAEELDVYQSTITNLELGKTYPGLKYLMHFYYKYGLNIQWLLFDHGKMFLNENEDGKSGNATLICHRDNQDPLFPQYEELMDLMKVPEVEIIILAKLTETKSLLKNKFLEMDDSKKKKKRKSS